MALGLFAFGIVGIIGLLPVALTTHREAKLDTVLAQIQQRLAAEVLLTDGRELAALHGFVKRFDAEGREIPAGAPDGEQRTVYRAKIVFAQFTPPGSSAASPSLQRALLYAVQDPGGDKLSYAAPSGAVLVAKAESAPSS